MDTAFNSLTIVTITHPSVIDDDVQLDLHTRAEPKLLSSPRFFLQCWRASLPGGPATLLRPLPAGGLRQRLRLGGQMESPWCRWGHWGVRRWAALTGLVWSG